MTRSFWDIALHDAASISQENCNIFCNRKSIPVTLETVKEVLDIRVLLEVDFHDKRRIWSGVSDNDRTTMWTITWCPHPESHEPSAAAVVGLDIPPYTVLEQIAANHQYLYFVREKEYLS